MRVHAQACVRARGEQSQAVCVHSAGPSVCLPAHLPVRGRHVNRVASEVTLPQTWLRASRLHGRPGNRIDFLSWMFDNSDKALDDPVTESDQVKRLHGYGDQVQVGSLYCFSCQPQNPPASYVWFETTGLWAWLL